MYVSRLEANGFRSLTNIKIEDMKPITLLFGKNGAGKSSILALLESIFCEKIQPGDTPGAPEVIAPFYRGIIRDFANNYRDNKPGIITFTIIISMKRTELGSLWPRYLKEGIKVLKDNLPEDHVKIKIEGAFQPANDDPHHAFMILKKVDINGYVIYDEVKKPIMWLPNESGKVTDATRAALGESLLVNFTGCFSNIGIARFLHDEATVNEVNEKGDKLLAFKTRLFKLKQSSKQDDQDQYRLIRNIFSEMTPWGEMDFAKHEDDSNELEVMSWDKDELWLPVSHRGAGAEQLLVIISEVIMRKKAIIGIEELESNLDEDTQSKLVELLRKTVGENTNSIGQIIATAHSCFYGYYLPDYEKKYVIRKKEGDTDVEPWSATAHNSLFKHYLLVGKVKQKIKKEKGGG